MPRDVFIEVKRWKNHLCLYPYKGTSQTRNGTPRSEITHLFPAAPARGLAPLGRGAAGPGSSGARPRGPQGAGSLSRAGGGGRLRSFWSAKVWGFFSPREGGSRGRLSAPPAPKSGRRWSRPGVLPPPALLGTSHGRGRRGSRFPAREGSRRVLSSGSLTPASGRGRLTREGCGRAGPRCQPRTARQVGCCPGGSCSPASPSPGGLPRSPAVARKGRCPGVCLTGGAGSWLPS